MHKLPCSLSVKFCGHVESVDTWLRICVCVNFFQKVDCDAWWMGNLWSSSSSSSDSVVLSLLNVTSSTVSSCGIYNYRKNDYKLIWWKGDECKVKLTVRHNSLFPLCGNCSQSKISGQYCFTIASFAHSLFTFSQSLLHARTGFWTSSVQSGKSVEQMRNLIWREHWLLLISKIGANLLSCKKYKKERIF